MGFYATVFWNNYRWNDFNEILKLKQNRDVETISFFMKRGPGHAVPLMSPSGMTAWKVSKTNLEYHQIIFFWENDNGRNTMSCDENKVRVI